MRPVRSCLCAALLAACRCLPACGGSGAGTVDADALTSFDAYQDADHSDTSGWQDAGLEAGANPHVIQLPPSGQTDIWGYSNSGYTVTWGEKRGDPVKSTDVYYFDILSRTEYQVTDRDTAQRLPYIHGNEIMFDDSQFYDALNQNYQIELYLYDITTAIETRLTDSSNSKYWVKFNQDYMLYYSDEGCPSHTDRNLSLMNRHTQEVSVLADCDQIPETHSISESFAAWVAFPAVGSSKDVFVRDLQAGLTFRIESTDDVFDQYFPHTDDEHVVWQDYRDGWREIYMYTFATRETVCLTPDEWEQAWPTLRSGIVSWCDYRYSQEWGEYGRRDIYVYEIATGVGRRVTTESDLWMPRFVDSGWILYSLRIDGSKHKLYVHDLVGDAIMTADGHVIP